MRSSDEVVDATCLGRTALNWLQSRLNPQLLEALEKGAYRRLLVPEIFAPSDSNKGPPQSLQNGLAVHVGLELLRRMELLSVALDGEPPSRALDHEIDSEAPDLPLRCHPVTGSNQTLEDLLLENGVETTASRFHTLPHCAWICAVLEETPAEIARLQIHRGVQRMNDPELIPGATDSHVVALFEVLLFA